MDGYLNVSSFFDGVNKLELQQDVVATKMDAGHGADDDVRLFDGIDQALMIGERAVYESGSLLLERQQQLQLVYIQPHRLRPPQHVRRMALC